MSADHRSPLEYLHGIEPEDLPHLENPDVPSQPAPVIAVYDPEARRTTVFIGVDSESTRDPEAARQLLTPTSPLDQVIVGWSSQLDGIDADASSLHFEVHWRVIAGGPWHTARLIVDVLSEDAFTFPALMEAASGAPVALAETAVVDAMRDGEAPPPEATIVPRTPLTALAGYLMTVAAPQIASAGWDRKPDPPGPLSTSQFAQLPSMRTAERNARKIARSDVTVSSAHRAFAPFLAHQVYGAREAALRFADAQPLVIAHELLAALPDFDEPSQAVEFALHAPLPLSTIYLDCTDGSGTPAMITSHTETGRERQASPLPLFGALMWRDDAGLHAVPFGRASADGPSCEPIMHLIFAPEITLEQGVVISSTRVFAHPTPDLPAQEGQQLARVLGAQACLIGELLASVLMLTAAARVEVAPRHLSAKKAKLAARRGQAPGWEIIVRATPAPAAAPSVSGEGRSYRHPFYRRGSFAAYPAGTRMADAVDPELLVWIPWKNAHCRLVWHPPTIVGTRQAAEPTVARRARRWPAGKLQLPGR